jgi:hypothetical protein
MTGVPTTAEVLDEVNRAHERAWRLVGALEGGWQSGASLVEDDDGQAVLKWSDRAWWADRVLGAEPMVRHARSLGYPTPAWLAVGATADGFPYQVQEFADGDRMDDLNAAAVDEFFALTALQRRVSFSTSVDWTNYIVGHVFDDSEGHQASLITLGGAPEEAVSVARNLAAPYRSAELVHSEMVHGDLSTDNVLVRGNRIVAVIDIEAIGLGCASFDLLTPAKQDYMWGDGEFGGLLMEEAIRRDGPAFFCIAVASQAINILAFGLDNWTEGISGAAGSMLGWMADARAAVA